MLPSQQPMMLETALAFEHLIKNPKTAQTKKKTSSQVGRLTNHVPPIEINLDCYSCILNKEYTQHYKLYIFHYALFSFLQGGVQITWDSVEQLEDYTSRLKAAAEKLTAENRRLRRCHADLVMRVGGVMNVDLLRQPQHWKDMLMDIRHMMASLIQVSSIYTCTEELSNFLSLYL